MNNSSNIYNLLLGLQSVDWGPVIVGVADTGGTNIVVGVGPILLTHKLHVLTEITVTYFVQP